MKTLYVYEDVSDQLVSKEKSHFMLTFKTSLDIIKLVKIVISILEKNSLVNYLGCPLYIGRQRIIYYSNLVAKNIMRISGWHSKILSFSGKVILVKHVLQSIPIHTLFIVSPPKTTLKYI